MFLFAWVQPRRRCEMGCGNVWRWFILVVWAKWRRQFLCCYGEKTWNLQRASSQKWVKLQHSSLTTRSRWLKKWGLMRSLYFLAPTAAKCGSFSGNTGPQFSDTQSLQASLHPAPDPADFLHPPAPLQSRCSRGKTTSCNAFPRPCLEQGH